MRDIYNSRGFGTNKQEYCKYLLSNQFVGDKIPVLCNQEHFLMRGNCYKIMQSLTGYYVLIKPAITETHDKGRAKNGMFIAVPDPIKNQINDISPGYWRIQAAILSCKYFNFLIINSYFPVDRQNANDRELVELMETLEVIKHTIDKNEFDDILWLGDINCDFLRNSAHLNQIRNFIEEFSIYKAWEKFPVDYTMCHEINEQTHVATLDLFFWNEGLNEKVTDAGVVHCPDNFSNHSPIYCVIKDDVPKCNQPLKITPPKPMWKKATVDEKESFQRGLDVQLRALSIPDSVSNCRDVNCKDETHCEEADEFITSVLDTINVTAHKCLPSSKLNKTNHKNEKKKIQPGWKEFVQPFREKAFFWSQVWKSAGRPINCELYTIMKRTRNVYHYQVKKIKKSEEIIKKNNLLDACLNGNSDVFTEIKKMRQHKPSIAASMDGVKVNVENQFKGIYDKLYNSVDDTNEMIKLNNEVESTPTLIPIIKDKLGSINSSKNYRSIAISSLILKLIDWIILTLFGVTLGLDDLQFAYQPGCSTTMCTWSIIETISYFMRNGSKCSAVVWT